jgi:hypothetical protein
MVKKDGYIHKYCENRSKSKCMYILKMWNDASIPFTEYGTHSDRCRMKKKRETRNNH